MTDDSITEDRSRLGSTMRRLLDVAVLLALSVSLACFLVGRLGPAPFESLASPWTLQVGVVMSLATVGAALLGRRRISLAMLPVLAWVGWVVIPVLLPMPSDGEGPAVRIVSINVGVTEAPDRAGLEWLASTRADLVALLECTPGWVEAVESIERDDGRRWSTVLSRPSSNDAGGIALFGLDPLRGDRFSRPVEGGLPQLEATATTRLGPLRILVVHPIPPLGARMTTIRNRTFDWMADRCMESPLPVIVVGDLNETPFGRTFRTFVADTGHRSVTGWSPSWPNRIRGIGIPMPLRIPIDHVLVPPGYVIRSHRLGPDLGSDHLPIVIEVAREPG